MALLAALESVDLVILFSEQTPVELIKRVRPDVYVKGGDYAIETLEETKVVKSWGGKAFAIPFIYSAPRRPRSSHAGNSCIQGEARGPRL